MAKAQEKLALSQWAQDVLDHAKRVQDLKRPAAASESQQPACSKQETADPPSSQLHSDFDAPAATIDVDATAPPATDVAAVVPPAVAA